MAESDQSRSKIDANLYETKALTKNDSGVSSEDISLIGGRLSRQNSRVTSAKAAIKDGGSESNRADNVLSAITPPSDKVRDKGDIGTTRVDKDKRDAAVYAEKEVFGGDDGDQMTDRKECVYRDISGQFYILTVHSPVTNSEDIVISEKLLKVCASLCRAL